MKKKVDSNHDHASEREPSRTRQSTLHAERIGDGNASPVMMIDPEASLLYANGASWLIVKQWHLELGGRLPDYWAELARSAYESGSTRDAIFTAGYVSTRLLFVPDVQEELVYVFGADATDDRQAEKDLLIKAHAQEQAHEAIVVTDADFRTIDMNPAYTRLTGYTKLDTLGEVPAFIKTIGSDPGRQVEFEDRLGQDGNWNGEFWEWTKSDEQIALSVSVSAMRSADGTVTHYVTHITDVTRRKQAEVRLEHLAHYDALTGLANRYLFAEHLKNATDHAERTGEQLAVMIIDLDGFKSVNDSFGHRFGDELLRQVALRMSDALRKSDSISRLGGDEFAVLVRNVTSRKNTIRIARKLLSAVSGVRVIEGNDVYITASIGIAEYPRDQTEIEALLHMADTAMYRVKQRSKNDLRFFSEEPVSTPVSSTSFQAALRKAVENGEIELYYQPQFECVSGTVSGAEALLRWTNENGTSIPPDEFVAVAEHNGLITALGEQALRAACVQSIEWERTLGLQIPVSVNVSVHQLHQRGFASLVEKTLAESGLPGHRLELEITESIFAGNSTEILAMLNSLRSVDVKISIDDFGTRYASLIYLKQLPIGRLKIDRLFIKDLPWDTNASKITSAVLSLAERLEYESVAEGVETVEQLTFLRESGCTHVQGYLTGAPVPAADFGAHLQDNRWKLGDASS